MLRTRQALCILIYFIREYESLKLRKLFILRSSLCKMYLFISLLYALVYWQKPNWNYFQKSTCLDDVILKYKYTLFSNKKIVSDNIWKSFFQIQTLKSFGYVDWHKCSDANPELFFFSLNHDQLWQMGLEAKLRWACSMDLGTFLIVRSF